MPPTAVYKLLLKYPGKLTASLLIDAIQRNQNTKAIAARAVELEGSDADDADDKKKEEKEKKNNDAGEEDEKMIMVELCAAHANEWTAHHATIANNIAIAQAVGDVPFADPEKLSEADKMLLLQDHVRGRVLEVIEDLCLVAANKSKSSGAAAAAGESQSPLALDSKHTASSQSLRSHLINHIELQPIHDEKERKDRFSYFGKISVDRIQDYYGDDVAFYVAWLQHYNWFLIVPSIFGLGIWAMNCITGMTVNTNPYVPLYSILIIFWSILFVKYWERQQSALACKWRSTYSEDAETVRPQFRGEMKFNEVTGQYEKFFPYSARVKYQLLSGAVTAFMLCVALVAQVCSLNLQGYMRGKHALLEIHFLADFADPGAIFDPDGNFALVPVILHAVVIMFLNNTYRSISATLTELENYRTQTEYDDSIIMKRFCFEFVDCFAALFYIAFYRLDIIQLRLELVSLYMVDQFRRVGTETLLPYILGQFNKFQKDRKHRKRLRKAVDDATKGSEEHKEAQEDLDEKVVDIVESLDEYENFDDYMELVMQELYVVLFASAFPLAACCSFVGNLVEIRSDLFKLSNLTKRPLVKKARDIGPWLGVLRLGAYASVITNALLFGFTSDQMRFYFPSFYDENTLEPLPGYGKFCISIIFGFEHVLLLIVLLIDYLVPTVPQDVEMELKGRKIKYVREAGAIRGNNKEKAE